MATSGNFVTSDSGQGGGVYYGRLIFEWWETGRGISGSVGYHNIAYHLKTYGGSPSYYQYLFNASMNVDGQGYSWGTTKAYGGGATSFGDYGKTLYTNSSGNRSFGASAQGGIFTVAINTSGSGSWALDNIPLHSVLTALSMDAGGIPATDEGPMWLEFSNPSGTGTKAFIESPPGGAGRVFTSGNVGSRYNFTFNSTLMEALQASSPNSNTFPIRIGIYDSLGGSDHYDYRDRTMTIKNNNGQANPTFSNFTYKDTNPDTVAVTGDDQYIVQKLSTLEVTVPVADKATPNKKANMSSYTTTIGSYSQSDSYSSVADVVRTVGAVSDVSGTQSLSVRAVDSRGNGTTVSKQITILPYGNPGFYGALNISYSNGFDATDGLTVDLFNGVTLASVPPLTIDGVDKNVPSTTNGVEFDISKNDNESYTGVWTGIPTTNATDHSGFINTDAGDLGELILDKMTDLGADNTTPWYVTFRVTDEFQTKSYTVVIDVGRPILRIGRDGYLYHNEVEFHEAFGPSTTFFVSGLAAIGGQGTFAYDSWSGVTFGPGALKNVSNADGDYVYFEINLNIGTYDRVTSMIGGPDRGRTQHIIAGQLYGSGITQFLHDNYASGYQENLFTLTDITIVEPGVYQFIYKVSGKNASASAFYQDILGLRVIRKS